MYELTGPFILAATIPMIITVMSIGRMHRITKHCMKEIGDVKETNSRRRA